MASTDSRLERLALDVAEGTAVDWDQAERAFEDSEERIVVRELRALAELSDVHRTLQRTPSDAPSAVASEETLPAETPRYWGDFEIVERVGEGSFGEVFRARDRILDREVALKLLRLDGRSDPERARAVLREGRLMARVKHPNVATIHGADERDGRVGLWMEFVEGKTLSRIVKDEGRFSVEETIKIGIELCGAVQAVHDAGILHRDIKAQNVMREADGRIVLMDFGVGRDRARPKGETSSLSGTPLYLAPELLQGDHPTIQSDLYSLGVLIFYLLAGHYPVVASTLSELRTKHASRLALDHIEALKWCNAPTLTATIRRSLLKMPQERFDSASAMGMALNTVTVRDSPRSHPRFLIAIATTIAVAAFLGTLISLKQPKPIRQDIETSFAQGGKSAIPTSLQCLSDEVDRYLQSILDVEESQLELRDPSALRAFARASCYEDHTRFAEAIPALEHAIVLDPNFLGAHLKLADLQSGRGMKELAFETLTRALELPSDSEPIHGLWIKVRYFLNSLQFAEAEQSLLELAQRTPDDAEIYQELALLRDNQGFADLGIEPAMRARTLNPDSEINQGLPILLHAIENETDRALDEFEDAHARLPVAPYLFWGKGLAHLVAGDTKAARAAFRQMEHGGLTYKSFASLRLAETFIFDGSYAKATEALKAGMHIHNAANNQRNHIAAHLYLAELYIIAGHHSAASAALARVDKVPTIPFYLRALRRSVLLHLDLSELETAKTVAERVADLEEKYPSDFSKGALLHVQGEIALAEGDQETALQRLEESRAYLSDARTLYSLARLRLMEGDIAVARDLLEAICSNPGRALRDLAIIPWLEAVVTLEENSEVEPV